MTVSLRPLAESDFPTLARRLCDPRVLEWVYGRDDPHDVAKVAARFGPAMRGEEEPGLRASIVEYDGRDVGYLQRYPVLAPGAYGLLDVAGTWAADLFVGEPELWGRGIGTAALRLAVRDAFAESGATRVVIDPWVGNLRAIRSYEKAGFRKVRVLDAHELHEGVRRDALLLAIARIV